MKYSILSLALILAACSTPVPVSQRFPDVPKALVERCDSLRKIEGDKVAITEMFKTTACTTNVQPKLTVGTTGTLSRSVFTRV